MLKYFQEQNTCLLMLFKQLRSLTALVNDVAHVCLGVSCLEQSLETPVRM